MKNCVLLIIDSLNYSHVQQSPELMPFLKELEKKSVSCSNMFAQAPYTEAAVMNIYCGQNVLDNGGYFFRFKDVPTTLFETLKGSGYTTFYNSYQPQCHPSSVKRGVDRLYYNVGYDFAATWSYRLSHFSSLYKENKLTETDYQYLIELFDDNLSEWKQFVEKLIAQDESTELIATNSTSYDAVLINSELSHEIQLYKNDKISYINNFLLLGKEHKLFSIPAFNQDFKIKDRSFLLRINKKLKPLFKKIFWIHFKQNFKNALWQIIKNPFPKILQFLKHPNKATAKDLAFALIYSFNYLFDLDLFQRIKPNYDSFKNAPSGRTHINHYINWAKQSKDSPHFACIHIDDIHNPEIFFTYDSTDMDLIDSEIEEAKNVLQSLPSNYHGNVTHDLSLRYADGLIKYLFDSLSAIGTLNDTYVAICADHGYSFSGNPIRNSFGISLFLECYKIPFVLYGKDLSPERITRYTASKDIPSTICDVLNVKIPECFAGNSLFGTSEYSSLSMEYCGGGCPDLFRRQLKMSAYDKSYFVGILARLDESLDHCITEIYDLENDPGQTCNLVHKSYNISRVKSLLEVINARRNTIMTWALKNN